VGGIVGMENSVSEEFLRFVDVERLRSRDNTGEGGTGDGSRKCIYGLRWPPKFWRGDFWRRASEAIIGLRDILANSPLATPPQKFKLPGRRGEGQERE
jgi:hypothetical protein